jgi:hypothetical protein
MDGEEVGMNLIRKHYGLKWRGNLPSIPWPAAVMVTVEVIGVFAAYMAVDYMERADMADMAAQAATERADRIEANMIACLNNKPLVNGRTAIFCDTKEIQL